MTYYKAHYIIFNELGRFIKYYVTNRAGRVACAVTSSCSVYHLHPSETRLVLTLSEYYHNIIIIIIVQIAETMTVDKNKLTDTCEKKYVET